MLTGFTEQQACYPYGSHRYFAEEVLGHSEDAQLLQKVKYLQESVLALLERCEELEKDKKQRELDYHNACSAKRYTDVQNREFRDEIDRLKRGEFNLLPDKKLDRIRMAACTADMEGGGMYDSAEILRLLDEVYWLRGQLNIKPVVVVAPL